MFGFQLLTTTVHLKDRTDLYGQLEQEVQDKLQLTLHHLNLFLLEICIGNVKYFF